MLIHDLYISIHGLKPRPGFLIAFSYRPVGRKLYILVISIHSRAMTNQAITFLKVFDLFCDVWKYLKDFIWDGSLIFYNLFEIHQDLKNNSKIRVDLAAIKDKNPQRLTHLLVIPNSIEFIQELCSCYILQELLMNRVSVYECLIWNSIRESYDLSILLFHDDCFQKNSIFFFFLFNFFYQKHIGTYVGNNFCYYFFYLNALYGLSYNLKVSL